MKLRTPYTPAEIDIIKAHRHLTARELALLLPGRTAGGLTDYRAVNKLRDPRIKKEKPPRKYRKPVSEWRERKIPFWTAEDKAILKANRHLHEEEVAALLPVKRSKMAIRTQRRRMGIAKFVSRKSPPWSAGDTEILYANGHLHSRYIIPMLSFPRTKEAVGIKRRELGIKGPTKPLQDSLWSDEEVAILWANPTLSAKELEARLPGRSWRGIRDYRHDHNIARPRSGISAMPPWTDDERAILLANPDLYSTKFGELLPHRTAGGIQDYRIKHGYPHPTKFMPETRRVAKPKAPPKPKAAKPPKIQKPKFTRPPVATPAPKPVVQATPQPAFVPQPGVRYCTALLPLGGDKWAKCPNPIRGGAVCPSCQSRFKRSA